MSELENFLRREIKSIVLAEKKEEGEDSSGKKEKKSGRRGVKRGKIGKGGVKNKIKEAGALASEKPKELMKRLGISGAPSGASDYDKVVSLARVAIFGNETMGAAYGGAKVATIGQGEDKSKVIIVSTRKITPRDGALYMLHTITGAFNAGLLGDISSEITVGEESGQVVIRLD